jgi:hypothetical protein
MIVVEKDQKISDFLNQLDIELGAVKLDLDGFEAVNIQHDELYLVDSEILSSAPKALMAKLEKCLGIIAFGQEDSKLAELFPNLISFINEQSNSNLIKNKIELLKDLITEREVLKSQLLGLNRELSEAMGSLEVELLKVKKVYEQKLPRRLEDVKGIHFYSKYCAGENTGGEFFDLYRKQNKVMVMMSSTSSYLASSSLLTFFTHMKMQDQISQALELEFIRELGEEVKKINTSKKKPIEMHLFTCIIDLATFEVNGHAFGKFQILSSNAKNSFGGNTYELTKGEVEESSYSRKLTRDERLLLASPGFMNNWARISPEFMIEDLLTKPEVKPVDILDETFFQMKKDSESGFLPIDASAVMLEVDKNVMLKI